MNDSAHGTAPQLKGKDEQKQTPLPGEPHYARPSKYQILKLCRLKALP